MLSRNAVRAKKRHHSKKRQRMILVRRGTQVSSGVTEIDNVSVTECVGDLGPRASGTDIPVPIPGSLPEPVVETLSSLNSSASVSSHIHVGGEGDLPMEVEYGELEQSFTDRPSDIDFTPTKKQPYVSRKTVSLGNQLYVAQTSTFEDFIHQINRNSRCKTTGCKGDLIPVGIRTLHLGGAIHLKFACSGCENRHMLFQSSVLLEQSQRTLIGFALEVAFIVGGCTQSQYRRVLRNALGINCFGHSTFDDAFKLMYKPVLQLLREQCDEAKAEMKALPSTDIGSWKRSVTTSDGVWLTRGHHSRNHTYSLRNSLNGSLLYFKHLCMRGHEKDSAFLDENDVTLYEGTAKAAEGIAADYVFSCAKRENLHIEVHWQDGDSTSENSFREHFPDEEKSMVMLCSGHAARSHIKALTLSQKVRKFSSAFCNKHKKHFPNVDQVKCCCSNKYSRGCGCLSKAFCVQARLNFHCCLKQSGTSAASFSLRMQTLGKYHARDIHHWEGGDGGECMGGECGFHQLSTCSCGKCDSEDEIQCEGKPYHTKCPLTCPLHALAYEIECYERASQSKKLLHQELGKGNSNIVETSQCSDQLSF